MSFLLQDEPEKGRRGLLLLTGVFVGSLVWGGGLYAASNVEAPPRPRRKVVRMKFVTTPPPAAPPSAPPVAPPTAPPEPPKLTPKPEPTPPKQVRPKKKKKRRKPPKKKPAPKPRAAPPPEAPPAETPQTPSSTPPKPAPVQLGMTFESTSARGRGPAVQVGNAFGGYEAGRAKAPERRPAPGGTTLRPGQPAAERTRARVATKVRPKYTKAALRAGVEGQVVIVVTIGADGRVREARLIRGLGFGLDARALEAVQRWRFHPARSDGRAVQSTKRIKVDFVIED